MRARWNTLFRFSKEWTTYGRLDFRQKTRAVFPQPREREVHEGANSGHGEPALRRNEVHRPWWRLVAGEHDFELSPPHMLRDVKGQHARHAAPGEGRSPRRAHAVAHQACRELNRSKGRRTGRR